MHRQLRPSLLFIAFVVSIVLAFRPGVMAAVGPRGITIREGVIYIAPDAKSAKLADIGRGREVVVLEHSPGWVQVVGTVEVHPELESERNVTGWMLDKGVITAETPDGDRIVFGEAVDAEWEASSRGGRKGAAQDALRLYERMAEYFPSSPLAAEAMYRAADIRWQLDAADQATRPSAKQRDPAMRVPIDESYMKKVIKKYPGSKWADLAAYHLIDNKLCGDWEAVSQCPLKESELYLKYAEERPKSPKAPEALYQAAWRYAALVVIFKNENQPKRSEDAAARSVSIGKKLVSQYPEANDWVTRTDRLIYMVQNNIPAWGNTVE
jgi:hypothetical protein